MHPICYLILIYLINIIEIQWKIEYKYYQVSIPDRISLISFNNIFNKGLEWTFTIRTFDSFDFLQGFVGVFISYWLAELNCFLLIYYLDHFFYRLWTFVWWKEDFHKLFVVPQVMDDYCEFSLMEILRFLLFSQIISDV